LHVCPFSYLLIATVDSKFGFQDGAVVTEGKTAAAIPDTGLKGATWIVGTEGDASGVAGQRLRRLRL
jgi:hypothetical protein